MTVKHNIAKSLYHSRPLRRAVTQRSLLWFFLVYFNHYISYELAPFHRKIIGKLENDKVQKMVVMAFRNSAKSTICTSAYPLWAILGVQERKNILIVSKTQKQSRQHLRNIKDELETNELLAKDLGPFQEESSQWGLEGIILPHYGAKISCISMETGVRGLRHRQYRPDVIIFDDIEDLDTTSTLESRDKTYEWLTSEIIPAGSDNCRYIFVGNLVHEDSVLMRLKASFELNPGSGTFLSIPIVDEKNVPAWPSKFPTAESLEKERIKIGNDKTWRREYLLQNVRDENQPVKPEAIHFYDGEPFQDGKEEPRFMALAIDPAVSLKASSDFTSMVAGVVTGRGANMKIYILPNPLIAKLQHEHLLDEAEARSKNPRLPRLRSYVYVESVGYQAVIAQGLRLRGVKAEEITINSAKDERLIANIHLLYDGKVLFPKTGAEDLIKQLLNFPNVKHDDAVDAFSLLINTIVEKERPTKPVGMALGTNPFLSDPYNNPNIRLDERKQMMGVLDMLNKQGFFL